MHYKVPDPALDLYREKFREMIEKNSPVIIGNQSKDHALIILQELISSAKSVVHISCTRLSSAIYGNSQLLNMIKGALQRNVEFYVSVKDENIESGECLNILRDNNISIMKCEYPEMRDFCVVDGKRFRLEMNQSTKEARVCACCPELASLMVQQFKSYCTKPYYA